MNHINVSLPHSVLCRLRTWHDSFFSCRDYESACIDDADTISDLIYEQLTKPGPCMIGRFGSGELNCLANYLGVHGKKNPIDFIFRGGEPWWWMPQRIDAIVNCAGFFPEDIEMIERYCRLLLEDAQYLDVLGSWRPQEALIHEQLSSAVKVSLPYLEPYFAKNPWSRALAGKKVLVVHPFSEQIKSQYASCRGVLFQNAKVLPEFELKTLTAVQSIGGEAVGYNNWFEALEHMEHDIENEDFDICLIGCGAYGFHLAAFVKRIGKKSVHLGGALQLLFGIKGNRWNNNMIGVKEFGLPYGFYPSLFNEHWIRPGSFGRPEKADMVEGACYW